MLCWRPMFHACARTQDSLGTVHTLARMVRAAKRKGANMTDQRITDSMRDDAHRTLRADYWQDVRDCAEDIAQDARTRHAEGETDLREWLMERVHETVDGHSRVIYTGLAIETVLYSDNDGAYVEDFGADGLVTDGAINWSALAYSAFEHDVIEQLESCGLDVNADDLGLSADDDESEDA